MHLDPHADSRASDDPAMLVLDRHGAVLTCTAALESLVGRSLEEIRGRPATELLERPGDWPGLLPLPGYRVMLRRRSGGPVAVQLDVVPLREGSDAGFLVRVVPAAVADRQVQDEALVRALFTQTHIGLAIHDAELRTIRVSPSPEFAAPPGEEVYPLGARLDAALLPEDATAIQEQLRRVADTGEPLIDWIHTARHLGAPDVERIVTASVLRLQDSQNRLTGVASIFTDITDQVRARQQLNLIGTAAKRLEGTLDVVRCAEQLVEVMVPEFADMAAVDLTDPVLRGEEPSHLAQQTLLRRVAGAAADGEWPPGMDPIGSVVRIREQDSKYVSGGSAVLVPDIAPVRARVEEDPELGRLVMPESAASLLVIPLNARGLVLGGLIMWRTANRAPFDQDDAVLGEVIGSRAALGVDNARRYTREHHSAEALQRSLLPRSVLDVSAAETVGSYVPAATTAGIGGSWFDVIALSSSRVALVVGDVVGHGLEATAATGRLRTAVQTLSDLDMAPDELLSHLDDLVVRLTAVDENRPTGHPDAERDTHGGGVFGSTCLYVVYDPVTGHCSMASAGHPPPVLVRPGEAACVADLRPGPVLGVGGVPFEQLELDLVPGSLLTLFTGKLLAHPEESAEQRLQHLCDQLEESAAQRPGSPAEVGRAVLDRLLPGPPAQDLALLVSRVRALPADATVHWEFPGNPEAVARARDLVTAQLLEWGLEHLAFTTELIASELVTNSIRYAGAPVGLRLIRDKVLICEVSDPSQTQPRLRRARLTDEGGRGLFLIAQLAHRWGSRYTPYGKTIWTEQLLNPG